MADIVKPETSPSPTVNLMVDLQYGTLTQMTPEAQKRYLDAVEKSITDFRNQGIPTIWITIGHQAQLHTPEQMGMKPTTRDDGFLFNTNFFTHIGVTDEASFDHFATWLARVGPKTNEVVLEKTAFSSFEEKHGLLDYLKTLGVKNLTVMGGNADVCVLETAVDAAARGFKTTIVSDLLVSRDNPDWTKPAQQYKAETAALLGKILYRPHELEGMETKEAFVSGTKFSAEEKVNIKQNIDMRSSTQIPVAPAAEIPTARRLPAPKAKTALTA